MRYALQPKAVQNAWAVMISALWKRANRLILRYLNWMSFATAVITIRWRRWCCVVPAVPTGS